MNMVIGDMMWWIIIVMIKETTKAYMAGIVDADGSISISTVAATKQYVVKVAVTNTKVEMVNLFIEHFGGKLRKRKWKNSNWKDCYEWSLTANKAAGVIQIIMPYLIIKKRQGDLALRLNRAKRAVNRARCRWDINYKIRKQKIYERLKTECKRLNHRGTTEYNPSGNTRAETHSG